MTHISVEEAAGRLAELVKEARQGAEITLLQDGNPIAKLVPMPFEADRQTPRQAGSAKGMLVVPDDFDEPLEEFAEYM